MKIQKKEIGFLLFMLSVSSHAEAGILPGGLLVGEVLKWANDHWNYVKTGHFITATSSGLFDETCYKEKKYTNALTGRVLHVISQISAQLVELSEIVDRRRFNLQRMINKLKLYVPTNDRLPVLVDKMGEIDALYDELTAQVVAQKIREFNGSRYCSFAYRQIYGDPLSIKVDRVYNMLIPSQKLGTTSWLADVCGALGPHEKTLCGTGHSPLDYIHSIYASLIMVEIKAYVMTAFSHNLLHNYNGAGLLCSYGQNPDDEIVMVQKNLQSHMQAYNSLFSSLMEGVSREFRACDRGSDFIRDETFFELEGAIQVVVAIPRFSGECSLLPREGSTALCHKRTKFCTTPVARNCLGSLSYCWSGDGWLGGCLAPKHSPRRYEFLWLRQPRYTWYGYPLETPVTNCPENRKLYNRVRPLCFCECVDNAVDSQSTHVINLQWVQSDVSQNMVITGIRFIVKHRIMQFQIQQGKLNSNFRVDKPEWKPVEDISEAIRAVRLNKKLHGEKPRIVENEDYLILSPPDTINLDTLHLSYSHVLTGVRFAFVPYSSSSGRGIQIQIKGTKFDYSTGKFCKDCNPEIQKPTPLPRQWYNYDKDNVANPIFPTKPASSSGQYISTSVSSMSTDSGQTTLPFFDALPLVSTPSVPLAGLGIFHKTAGKFTGFLSLKFVSLDYPEYMKKSAEHEKNVELSNIPTKGKSSSLLNIF